MFARGKHAWGVCDVCGWRYDLGDLRTTIVAGRTTNIKACPTCWDPDHPQLMLGRYPVLDPQALLDPRPDNGQAASRRYFGWRPVGGLSLSVTFSVGTVTVTV